MNNALFVAWSAGEPDHGRWGPVGRLERIDGLYRFTYTHGAVTPPGFHAFPGMRELDQMYESEELFPLFANRLLSKSRPEYEAYLTWGGFDPSNPPDPLAILGVTEGIRQTDSLEVFPCPAPDVDGCYVAKFFLHGLRWMPAVAIQRVDQLKPGEPLALMLDIQDPHDSSAVAVRTVDDRNRVLIGYVPRYLSRDIAALCMLCDADFLKLSVERVNGGAPLQMRVLCRMKACWPDGFHPCSGEEFQPIVNTPLTTEGAARARAGR